ncbi:MAG: hypothetical protein IKZ89_07295 [Bacteroidaceae bacterium]|nr:hypothetical protein [Bacteroidaceae bacterium]
MRDYKKHLTLLPHKWQVIGAATLAVAVVYYGIMFSLRDQFNGQNWFAMCVLSARFLLGLSLLLICFSKESVEDEYIASARYRALIISVFIFIIGWAIVQMTVQGPNLARHVIRITGMKESEQELFKSIFDTKLGGIYRVIANIVEVNSIELIYIVLLKILVRTGKAGGYDSLLLPYRYKKTGWWILIVSLIIISAVLFIMGHTEADVLGADRYNYIRTYVTVCRIMVVFPYIGLMIICLTKEQQEDEFIRHIRVRVLALFVIIYVVSTFFLKQSFFATIVYITAHNHRVEGHLYDIIQLLERLFRLLSFVPLLSVVYALVLRKVLSNNLKESNDEK